MQYATSIGIDVHAKTNEICALITKTGELRQAKLSSDPDEIIRWIQEEQLPRPLGCCYEAGPTGFWLARTLNDAGIACAVVATSKLPKRIDRKKNDRIDAQWLARMQMAGSVAKTYIPSSEEEALCHLSRLRGEVAADLRRAKQRVAAFLLLTKTSYTLTKKRWTKTFITWAGRYEFKHKADTYTFRTKVSSVLRLTETLNDIEDKIMGIIKENPVLTERMSRLLCMHGIGPVTAFSLICEVYDFTRFRNGSAFASYLGLVPSENSTGKKTSRGKITKLGNSHLRRLIVESTCSFSKPSKEVVLEDETVPEAIRLKARQCRTRLYKRRCTLKKRNMAPNKIRIALARELSEWIYHIAVMEA